MGLFGKKNEDTGPEPEWKKKKRAHEAKKAREAEIEKKKATRAAQREARKTETFKRKQKEKERILATQKDPFSQSLGEEEGGGLVEKISGIFKIQSGEDTPEEKEKKRKQSLKEKQEAARKALEAQDLEKVLAARARRRLMILPVVLILAGAAVTSAISSIYVPPRSRGLQGFYTLTSYTKGPDSEPMQGLLDITETQFNLRLFKEGKEDTPVFVQDSTWEAESVYVRATNKSWSWVYSYREAGGLQLETIQNNEGLVLTFAPRPPPTK